jgi:hypothetical protein
MKDWPGTRRLAGGSTCVHGHAGTSALTIGVGTWVTGRTCRGFALYGPASRTHSIIDLLQQRPALPAEANLCEDTNRGGCHLHWSQMDRCKIRESVDSKYQK